MNNLDDVKRTNLSNIVESVKKINNISDIIKVSGWVRTLRNSKSIAFIELNDGSMLKNIQIILEKDKLDNFDDLVKLNVGSAVTVLGAVVPTPSAKAPFEISAKLVKIEGNSTADYPLQKKRHSMEYLRTIAHLRPRTNTFSAVFRVRSVCAFAIHSFFNEGGFVYVHTPIITSSDSEGAGEMFHVTTLDLEDVPKTTDGGVDFNKDFFAKHTSLTVSGQLAAEAMALAFDKVYTFGPTFRAENSNTTRHAAEFWMIEPEIAFADLDDDMQLAWDMLIYVVRDVLEKCPQEIDFFTSFFDSKLKNRLETLVGSSYVKLSYTEAVGILEEHIASGGEFVYPVYWGCDLKSEHEKYITEKFASPVFLYDYPKEIKAFYMRLNDDGKTVAAMDLLVPGVGEIIGGSQREEREDYLVRALAAFSLSASDYSWYTDLRRFGGVCHAGFGLGFERLLMYITGISNIRDVIPFPRTQGVAEF